MIHNHIKNLTILEESFFMPTNGRWQVLLCLTFLFAKIDFFATYPGLTM